MPDTQARAYQTEQKVESAGGVNLAQATTGSGAGNRAEMSEMMEVTPEANALLTEMRQAYQNLGNLEMEGTLWARFELQDDSKEMKHRFNSAFRSPNQFKHVMERDLLIGSSGTNIYIYQKSANAYYSTNVTNLSSGTLPKPLPHLLQAQNPSLLMALAADPLTAVGLPVQAIHRTNDVSIGGMNYPALALQPADGDYSVVLVLDPNSKLLRRFTVDIDTTHLKEGGEAGPLKRIQTEVDYASMKQDGEFGDDFFAWAPPEGAENIATLEEEDSAAALEGQDAPFFSLENLDGTTVSLSDLKGHVVVLDFWATWCPPCRKSLPGMAQLFQDKKDAGVHVYAVNIKEDKGQIEAFLKGQSITIPVLLDVNGEVAALYQVTGIPQTVVIGKDGKVRRVFVGLTPETEKELRAEVELANREQ